MEEQNIEMLKHTVSYSRKKNLGNYESEDVGLFIQFHTEAEASLQEIFSEGRKIGNALKAEVLEALGLEYTVADDGTVDEVVRVPEAAKPKAKKAGPTPAADSFDEITEGGVGSAPPFSGDTKDKEERKSNASWAKARYALYPNEFWDNRERNAEKGWNSPDFVHKDSRAGFYA